MIVTFSTFWSRTKRRKVPALSCYVSTVEIIAAAVGSAEKEEQPLVLSIRAGKDHILTEILAVAAYKYAHHSKELVLIEIKGVETKESITRSLLGAAQVISFSESEINSDLAKWLRTHAHPSLAISGNIQWTGNHHDLPELVQKNHLDMVHLQASYKTFSSSLQFLAEARRKSGVPILVSMSEASPTQLKQVIKSGIDGLGVGESLIESFAAGLRTGLRSRSSYLPSQYFAPASKAVSQSVHHYSNLFNQ